MAREVFTGHLVINSAVLPLHFLHPLQLIANLIQNIRNPVAAFRNAACVSIQLRILLVCIQQICYCLCRRYNVSAIVPGIMPAAGNIDLLIGAIPFYIGDVLDVFKRSYVENLKLITGYIEDDKEIINKVNKKAFWTAVFIVVLCWLIYVVISWAIRLGTMAYDWIVSLF